MEERSDPQLELLAGIHNHLVDLKKIIVETESARPGVGQSVKDRLSQLVADDQYINAEGHSGAVMERQQKIIAPTNTGIEPGEGAE